MRKFLCTSILLSVFCCTNVHAASTDDIRNACYPVSGRTSFGVSKCGAKNAIYDATVFTAVSAGAVLGGIIGTGKSAPGVGTLVGIAAGGYAGYLAGDYVGGKLSYNYKANEYIYFDNGSCLECDTHNTGEHWECPNGTVVSEGSHWFTCRTTDGGDYWTEFTPMPCPGSIDKSVKNSLITIRAAVSKPAQGVSGVGIYSGDVCLEISCGDGVLDKETNSCVPKDNGADDDKKPDDTKSECAEYISSDYNLFEQCSYCHREKESGAFWDSKSKICRCIGEVNKDKEWNAEQGKCVAKGGGDEGDEGDEGDDLIPVTQCVTVLNELSLFVKTNCVSLSTKVESLMELCMSGHLTVAMWNSQSSVIRNSCLNQQESPKQKLVTAAEKLDTMFAGFKVSKWKNEEGKFNTARLASDSIAGVVLGTTGGLITSSVMKKKQVEQGFEDLQCVVGGQPVAGWGDEFMVGIQ